MASGEQIGHVYDDIDELWRATFGPTAEFSNALYDGDFTKTLGQAQDDKHRYVLSGIGFTPGDRVLDVGCGWGAMLSTVRNSGGYAIGLTLSKNQAEACADAGLEAIVQDWKDCDVSELGKFNAVVSLGAFEHFCSGAEYRAGKQDEVYDRFFRLCYDLLPPRGRLYLQTMLWGQKVPSYENVSLSASRDSSEYMLAVIERVFLDGCFPFGVEQLQNDANPYFTLVSRKNGRLDYIHTIEEWRRQLWRLNLAMMRAYAKQLRHVFGDAGFRYKFELLRRPYYAECFRREVIDHERMVFERR